MEPIVTYNVIISMLPLFFCLFGAAGGITPMRDGKNMEREEKFAVNI